MRIKTVPISDRLWCGIFLFTPEPDLFLNHNDRGTVMKKFWFATLIVLLDLILSLPVQAKTANILSPFGDRQNQRYKVGVVQPTHLFHMEQYPDLIQYVVKF